MQAQIFGLSQANVKILKRNVDGMRKLGCEKVHVRVNYDQAMAIPEKNHFYAL